MKKEWDLKSESEELLRKIETKLNNNGGEKWFNSLCLLLNTQDKLQSSISSKEIEVGVYPKIDELLNNIQREVDFQFSPYDLNVRRWLELCHLSKVREKVKLVSMCVGEICYPNGCLLSTILKASAYRGLKKVSVEAALMLILDDEDWFKEEKYYFFATNPLRNKKGDLILLKYIRGMSQRLGYVKYKPDMAFDFDIRFVFAQ